MKPRGKELPLYALAVYILEFDARANVRAWVLRTEKGGELVQPFSPVIEKALAVRYSANRMREFVKAGQHCELKIRNKRTGRFMPARTFPRSADPKRSRG